MLIKRTVGCNVVAKFLCCRAVVVVVVAVAVVVVFVFVFVFVVVVVGGGGGGGGVGVVGVVVVVVISDLLASFPRVTSLLHGVFMAFGLHTRVPNNQ